MGYSIIAFGAEGETVATLETVLDDYEPAVPTTAEGVVAAGGGFLAVLIAGSGLGLLFRRRA